MSNSTAPGSSADVNVKVTALTTNPNVPVTYKTIILKKNLVNGVNTLTQEMMSIQNTKYVIKYDYILSENITMPVNCILEFDGGSIGGNYGFNGSVINEILYASWFTSTDALLYTINNLQGYKILSFEDNKTYLFNSYISPKEGIIIEGNNATIKCVNNGIVSNKTIQFIPQNRVEFLGLRNLNIDGNIDSTSFRKSDVRYDAILIKNVDNVELYNIKIKKFNMPNYINENTEENGYSPSTTIIQIQDFHNIDIDKLTIRDNRIYGEVIWLFPIDRTNTSKDTSIIKNSIIDFSNENSYTAVNCYGRLIFDNNEVIATLGALNAFVNNSTITNNRFYNMTHGSIIDLSEGDLFAYESNNVYIANNIVKGGIGGFLSGYGVKNITIENNKGHWDTPEACFKLFNDCENIVIKGNNFTTFRIYQSFESSGHNKNIIFENNTFSGGQTDEEINRIFDLHYSEENLYIIGNIFNYTTNMQQLILSLKDGKIFENIIISNNVFNIPVNTPIINTGRGSGNRNTYNNFVFTNNICTTYSSSYIEHGTPNISIVKDNDNIRITQNIYSDLIVDSNRKVVISDAIVLKDNAKLTFNSRTCVTFKDYGYISGGKIEFNGTTKLQGKLYIGELNSNSYSAWANTSSKKPQHTIVGTQFFDTTLKKPIWYLGSGIWVDAYGNYVTWPITYVLENIVASNYAPAEGNAPYSTILTAVDGYQLPVSITVKFGNTVLTVETDYTYNRSTGEVNILGIGGSGGVTDLPVIIAYGTAV